MTALSPAALAQLNTPRNIPYSVLKLLVRTIVIAGGSALFLIAPVAIYLQGKVHGSKDVYMELFLVAISLLLAWAFTEQLLPGWRNLKQPAVSISKEGLTFAGKPLIPWAQIESNTWESLSINMASTSKIRIQAASRKIVVHSTCFKCDGDEYQHYCDLYQAASEHGDA